MQRGFLFFARVVLTLILVVAGVAAWGWITLNLTLAQLRPHHVLMQYNTAVCMILCSLAMFGLLERRRTVVWATTAVVIILAGVTLCEYLFNIDLHSARLIVPNDVAATLSDRIGFNTAIALLLTAAAILACNRRSISSLQAMGIAFVSSLIFALGAVPLLGYISGIEEAYRFGTFTRMSLPSSCCFPLLATILTLYAGMRSRTLHRWLPVPVFLALVTISFAGAIAVQIHERTQIEELLQQRVKEAATAHAEHVHDIYSALNRIGLRWETAGGLPHKLWQSDADAYLQDMPFLAAISRLDREGRVQWIAPEKEENQKLIGRKVAADPERAPTISQAIEEHAARVTQPLHLYTTHDIGYLYVRPLYIHGRYDGMIVSVFHLPRMMSAMFQRMDEDYYYSLEHDGTQLLSTLPPNMPQLLRWKASAPFPNLNDNYQLTIYPKPSLLAAQRSLLSSAVLGVGLLMSSLVAMAISLMLRERWQARLLRTSEQTFRLAMEQSPIGMALVSPEGRWLEVNQALCDLLGYSHDEFLLTDFQTITHPEDLAADLDLLDQVIEGKIRSYTLEKRYFHREGHEIRSLLSVSLVRNPDGSPKYFISMIQDITERTKLMEQLRQTNAELEQFAYVASHDLQEPLRMVTSFVGLIGKNYEDKLDAQGQEFITIAVEAAKRMQALINDLLEYARSGRESQARLDIDCNIEVKHALMNLETTIQASRARVYVCELPTIRGNPVEFLRLMQNLVGNGIKFQRAGVIPEIRVNAERDGECWVFSVADNGIGLKPEYYERIFQPFKRLHTQQEYHGSGIGLAVCRKIVENLGGRIWIESVVGEGSTVYFTVPVAE